MIPFPSSILVGPHRVPITLKDSLEFEGVLADGIFDPQSQSIEIRVGLSPTRAAETMLHEALHALNGIAVFVPDKDEERAVTILAAGLTKLAQDNPDFFRAWLDNAGWKH